MTSLADSTGSRRKAIRRAAQSGTRVSECTIRNEQTLQSSPAPAEQSKRRAHVSDREIDAGAYTITKVLERIDMARSTFYRLRDAGRLPFLEEVTPRCGKRPRYRADLIEKYVANDFNRNTLKIVGRRA